MSNWRELGVIPDSEDEDEYLDNDESLVSSPTPNSVKTSIPKDDYAGNIWDFPGSDDDEQSHISESKVSPIPPRPVLWEGLDLTVISSSLAESTTQNQIQSPPLNDAETNPPSLVFTFNEIASRNNQNTVDASSLRVKGTRTIQSNSITTSTSLPSTPQTHAATNRDSEIDQYDTHWDDTEAAFSYARSLRPRKPIQEHPYLLENAQYSSVLRQHGVKPVKMPIDIERYQLPGALPDDSFGGYSQDGTLPPGTDRTDDNSFASVLEKQNRLDISPTPSDLPQPYKQPVADSLTSSLADTVGDSVLNQDLPELDQDLPELNQLLNRYSRTSRKNAAIRETSRILPLPQRVKRRDIIYSDSPEPRTTVTQVSISPSPLSESSDLDTQQNAHSNPYEPIDRRNSFTQTLPRPLTSASLIEASSQESSNQDEHGRQEYRERYGTRDEAESDTHQLVTEYGRRIKGVLPASWLRLDQQPSKNNAHQGPKRKPQHRLPNQQQRGIALKKTVAPDSTTFDLLPLELDEEFPAGYTTDDMSEHQAERSASPTSDQFLDQIDESLVVERNSRDPVVVGSKRQLQLPKTSKSSRKRAKVSNGSRTQFSQTRPRQQTIAGFLRSRPDVSTESLTVDHFSNNSLRRSNNKRGNSNNKRKPPLKPLPFLSILDIIEPDAPRFIRIAARSAKQTLSQGRSNVQQKIIKLATRQDQVDAISVLEKWRSGIIGQRPSVSTASKSKRAQRQSANMRQERQEYSNSDSTSKILFGTMRSSSHRLVKHLGESGSVGYRRSDPYRNNNMGPMPVMGEMNALPSSVSRMAQLEVDERVKRAMVSFNSGKGTLDHIFRAQKQKVPNWHLAENLNAVATSSRLTKPNMAEHTPLDTFRKPERTRRKVPRFRKSIKPCRIDIKAPQYTHADDPLPGYPSTVVSDSPPDKSKLYGLGPYGTRYTHHFEIFPLMSEVRFHESTLLGSGILKTFWVEDAHLRISKCEPQISIRLGDQVFNWGFWNQTVSSEIGILFDSIAEQFECNQRHTSHDALCVINAVHSTLEYVRDAVDSAETESPMPPLISRLQEVFRNFIDRIKTGLSQSLFDHIESRNLILKILDRVLLISSLLIKHCQNTSQLMDQQPGVENLLLSLSQLMISVLLRCGLNQVSQIYRDFGQFSRRDRTLRESAVAIHSWTMLIKTFEYANPRQISFWGVLETIILQPHVLSGTDALEFEQVWETMFTFLPLFKFDDTGKIATEERYNAKIEGWGIPQKLIRRVFQLYQENNHQAASFNSYCRALVSRCYYLVQQWGWCHSAPVVGAIFDFFGSQKLAHLRNEEVYQSPQFLKSLAGRPILEIEADDCCFHIFLKLLAISIKKLRLFGSEKDIRNLVSRTIPNHNRLYFKEHKVLERDLAALRNHHDLIGTLFWAAPPNIRPQVTLVEGLITPASSHKEACLINIRAWVQLASFIVSSGEAKKSFEPFKEWRHTFFQQTMMQFEGIAADIHQQYLALSKNTNQYVTQDVVDTMISQNKAAVMEILHLSFTASANVMRQASDLEAGTYCLNTLHLERIFQYFTVSPSELDWSILRAALTLLEVFLSKIEEFKDNQESQQSESQILDSAQADDAFLILEQDISRSYFAMARCILSSPIETLGLSVAGMADKTCCIRQIIKLSARMGIGFINGGLLKISDMFQPGKHCLFSEQQHLLDPSQRQYFILFISTLLKQGFDDFSNAGFTACEVWVMALVTPLKYLKYENLTTLHRHCYAKGIVPDNLVHLTTQPSYKTNLRLFELTVSSMRKLSRSSEPNLGRVLSKTLELVMKLMRNDLGLMYMDTSQHQYYVVFVQGIISSIKAHASGLCTVDSFFLQVSREYSPPIQDPQLQIASMLSCGILIEEGEVARGAKQLFFLLLSNFKYALANGKLAGDARMLRKGMKHKRILAFVLGKMLPAIIRVSFTESSSFPLLDVYTEALRLLLQGRILSQQLDNDDLSHASITLRAIVEGMRQMRLSDQNLSGPRIHILRQALTISNLLWPSLLIANAESPENSWLTDITGTVHHIASFARAAQEYLRDLTEMGSDLIDNDLLFEGVEIQQPL
ncbi:hypothetical protein ACHAQJ_010632, partial [Trichoderma viride]